MMPAGSRAVVGRVRGYRCKVGMLVEGVRCVLKVVVGLVDVATEMVIVLMVEEIEHVVFEDAVTSARG
jgi:hypothetical protein